MHYWKKKNNIVSRKVNKILSRKDIADIDTVNARITAYRNELSNLILEYDQANVYNTHQSGFNIESSSGRTLKFNL